ncbi:YSIRK-type signal peptide-containing protein [Streptococcus suis]|nr:YSIRK-type signal peptide-containing protein [Streptococcus suis]
METANKKFRYSIRKFKVGVGSVLIATCLLGAGISTPTAFAMTDSSPAIEDTEVTKTRLQHLKELVEELKTDLAELEKLERYEKSAYPLQDYLWTDFSSVGIKEMERVSSLKEEDSQIPDIDPLLDFGNHIKWERLTREVALYRKKYPNNKEIEEEYKQHLEQTEIKTYASQEGFNLKTSTNEAEQAVERIKKIVQELEPKAEEKTPETKEETPVPTPDAAPAPTPKEEDAPAPKEDEVPVPTPEAEAPKAEEEIPTPMPEAPAPTPEEPKTEEDAPTPAPAPETPMDEPKMEEPKSEMPAPAPKEEEIPAPMPDAPAPKEDKMRERISSSLGVSFSSTHYS